MERDQMLGAEGYIPRSLLKELRSKRIQLSISFLLDSEMSTMAKGFAISIYKELRRLGFTEDQIADFSTELLKCLQDKLQSYKDRLQQKQEQKGD